MCQHVLYLNEKSNSNKNEPVISTIIYLFGANNTFLNLLKASFVFDEKGP